MAEIALLINNDIYRLGDAIMWDDYSSKLLTCNSYEATFLHKYLVNKDVRSTESLGILNNTISQDEELILPQRSKIAAITLSELVRNGKWEVPSPDELVVHLRLGDIIAFNHAEMKKYANYDETINKIRASTKKKVVIVTAMHYPSPECNSSVKIRSLQLSMSATSSHKESMLLLDRLKDKITAMGKSVEVRSSKNVDADFVYLCFSNELILSGISGFGRAAKMLSDFIMGREKCIVNIQCRQDWIDLAPKILWSLRSTYVNNINS
jgi:hypothetical protein